MKIYLHAQASRYMLYQGYVLYVHVLFGANKQCTLMLSSVSACPGDSRSHDLFIRSDLAAGDSCSCERSDFIIHTCVGV